MILRCMAIDVGNTSTAVGRVVNGRVSHVSHLNGGLQADLVGCEAAIRAVADAGPLDAVVLGSVVPELNEGWVRLVSMVTGQDTLIVTNNTPMPIKIDYPKPETVGADRLANASAAVVKYGSPAIVADFGTALTFDIIDDDSTYVGGVIAPGLPVMTRYLHEKTALLPEIKLGGRCPAIGRSTTGAMRIGAQVGYRGMVREIIEHLSLSIKGTPQLCATGGFARWALSGLDLPFVFDANLTLFGLMCICEEYHNQK